ncbi:MAG: EAL domain-containing protein [Actinobacteria bacterium]|nr:EAL domain-containing protein [Actinomycetota bacterium]
MIAVATTVLAATCAVLAAASWLAEARRPRVFPRRAAAAVAGAAALCAVAYPLVLTTEPGTDVMPLAGHLLLLVAALLGCVGTVGIVRTVLPRGGVGDSFAEGLLVGSSAVTTVWAVLSQPGASVPARAAAVLVATVLAGLLAAVLRMSVTARGHTLEARHTRRATVAAGGLALLLLAGLVDAVPARVPVVPTMLLAGGGFLLVAFVPYARDSPQSDRTRPTFAGLVLPYALLAVAATAVGIQVALGRAGAVTGLLVAVVGCSVVGVQVFAVRAGTQLLSDLELSRQRLEALVENAQDVILGLDSGGRVVAANAAVERLLARRPEHLEGRDVAEIAVLDDRPAVRDAVRDVVHRRRATAKVELRLAAPADGTAEMRLRVVDGGAVAVVSDVTDAVLLRERLQLLARHDRMTGLVNRGVVLDTVATWLASGAAVSVLYCDLDGYKAVNDRFGHLAGDAVLVEVARRLETAVRGMPADEGVLGRIGGDEFVVALRGVHGREAVGAGERLVAAMRPTFLVGDRTVRLGISIGISGTDDAQPLPALGAGSAVELADTPAAELLHRGDLAMFEAKAAGRAKVARWDPDVSQRALRRVDIAIGLRQALDTGRLALAYQPLVRLSDGVVVGVEALVRVEGGHDEPGALAAMSGFVSPAELVEVAEDTGEITELGQWVLRQATQRAALWRALGHELFVTVNMSVRQMSEADFVSTVRRALADSTLEPGRLVVEITEGQLVGEEDPVRDVIEDLRRDGVQFVIDDFGTGYSSLSYLKTMPVRAIKLDRTLLDGIGTDPRATTLARSVVGVARALGLVVVAEGLENLDAARLVRDLGAWAGQGFALYPPLREDELLDVLSAAPLDLSGGRHLNGTPASAAPPVPPVPFSASGSAVAGAPAGPTPANGVRAAAPHVVDVTDSALAASGGAADGPGPLAPGAAHAAGAGDVRSAPQTQGISLGGRRFGASGPVGEAPRSTGGTGGVAGVVLPPRVVSDGETGASAD